MWKIWCVKHPPLIIYIYALINPIQSSQYAKWLCYWYSYQLVELVQSTFLVDSISKVKIWILISILWQHVIQTYVKRINIHEPFLKNKKITTTIYVLMHCKKVMSNLNS